MEWRLIAKRSEEWLISHLVLCWPVCCRSIFSLLSLLEEFSWRYLGHFKLDLIIEGRWLSWSMSTSFLYLWCSLRARIWTSWWVVLHKAAGGVLIRLGAPLTGKQGLFLATVQSLWELQLDDLLADVVLVCLEKLFAVANQLIDQRNHHDCPRHVPYDNFCAALCYNQWLRTSLAYWFA